MRPPHALPYDWFSEHEVASYHRALCPEGEQAVQRTDDATWRDLDVAAYLRRIGARMGIFGRQMLYHRLRMGQGAADFAAPLQAPSAPVPTGVGAIRLRLRALEVDVTPLLFHAQQVQVPGWARWIHWAPIVLLLSLLLPFLNFLPGLHLGALTPWIIGLYLLFNGWTQVKLHSTLSRWNRQRDGVVDMLLAAQALGKLAQPAHGPVHPVLQGFVAHHAEVNRLLTLLSPTWVERTPMLAEYANLFALHAYAELGERSARLQAQLPALRAVYAQLATCEAQLGLQEHLQEVQPVCWARPFTPGPGLPVQQLALRDMVNPLLDGAAPITLALNGTGAFLSGQNGVGKSTLLRAVGLNLLAARAFGFCYCQEARLPDVPVVSSIHIEDSLHTADSLYMAEMRRAQTLVQKLSDLGPECGGAVFLIDEIFKGTNHSESVAAAAAVLQHLAHGGLVLVSSHNVVLAPLLDPALRPLRLVRISPGDAATALRLEPGVLTQTNGLQMMERYAFPDSVRATAARVHAQLSAATQAAGV